MRKWFPYIGVPILTSAVLLIFIPKCSPGPVRSHPSGDLAFNHKQTGLIFPNQLCDLYTTGTTKYPHNKLGHSVHYSGKEFSNLTIYIYNSGQKKIPEGTDSGQIQTAFIQSLQDIFALQKYGKYKHVQLKNKGSRVLKLPNGEDLDAYWAQCEIIEESMNFRSILLLTGYRNYFLKLRFFFPEEVAGNGERIWECILETLLSQQL